MPFVIVDDADPAIWANPVGQTGDYVPGFKNDKFTTSFYGEAAGTAKSVTTLGYPFNGSSISVFGSILNPDDGEPGSDTTLEFSVDGIAQQSLFISEIQKTDQHLSVFNSSSLSNDYHQFNMSFSFPGNDCMFYLDYFIYDAFENSTINGKTATIFIDDMSPYLQYSPTGWIPDHEPSFGGVTSQEAVTFNASIAQATTSGANVSLSFFGWGISIYGAVLNHGSAVAAYSIDGDGYEDFTMPTETATYPVYNWPFIPSAIVLEEGVHNLTITLHPDSESNSNPFDLDYILVNASKAYVPPPTTIITPQSGSTSSSSTPTSSSSSLDNGKHSSRTGAIAGGVIGGVLLSVLLVAMVQLLRRRKHRNKSVSGRREPHIDIDVHGVMTEGISPFPLANIASQASQRRSISNGLHLVDIDESQELETSETPPRSSKHDSRRIGVAEREGEMSEGRRRREVDSGIRALSDAGTTESTLPPLYTGD